MTTTIGVDAYPVCEGSLHQVEVNSREGPKTVASRRLLGCPKFLSASNEDKKEIFLKAKDKWRTYVSFVKCGTMIHLNVHLKLYVKNVILSIGAKLVLCSKLPAALM